jgi:sugar transferase (PEP-CTERM system associated)
VTGSLKLDEERVLFVGTGETARKVARQILDQHAFAYRIVGFIDDDASRIGERIVNPAVVGTPGDIDRLVAEHQIDRIVVGLSDRRGKLPVEELLRAKMAGIRVEDATTTYERVTGKILVDDLRPSWLIFSDGFRVSRVTRLMKRTIDLTLSLLMAVLALPLMAITTVLVFIEDGRPVLYRQERVGENGRGFVLTKFRSMRKDAEQGGTPIWAKDGDARITRVGRFIRKTRLDELPQLWNVIRGDMSFVGPRPERAFFVEQLSREIPFYQQRHAVKPGLTGWAQVKYRYGSSREDAMEKLRYDLYYIKHLSVIFDLTIVFDTVKVVLFGKGAA